MIKFENTQGITLVALVITVIVLLLLAGVTIIMFMGENGLIAKAQSAKLSQEVAEEKEQIEMALVDVKTEKLINTTGTTNVGEYLKAKGIIKSYETKEDGTLQVVTFKGYKYKIDLNNQVEYLEGKVILVPDLTEENVTFTYAPSIWTNGTVQVEITTSVVGYTLQYSIDGITWNTYTTSIPVTTNQVIYARLWDGTNYGGTVTGNVTNIEKIVPTISATQDARTTSIIITIDATDTESGIQRIQYNNSETWEDLNLTDITNGKRATKTVTTNGIYTFRAMDNAGNTTQTNSTVIGMSADIVNAPVLGTGMTPIKWNGTAWITTTSDDTEWYSYIAQSSDAGTSKWANAQTADGSMWVWIPRYAYKITSGYHTSTAGTIDIKFLNGTTDTAYDGTSCTRISATDTNYTVHPCFTNNTSLGGWDTELKGIWVAKFEASNNGSNVMQIKPGVISWTNITISNIYNYVYNYNRTLESHLMKNSEWGAVAYLAQSKYGRNGTELTANTSSSYYTGGGSGLSYTTNVAQSTTKNVYGIYDMSGGTYEYIAAYLNGVDISKYGANLSSAAGRYKQLYSSYASSMYGDAVYETSSNSTGTTSWNLDNSYFLATSNPFIFRGGSRTSGANAGTFYFYGTAGGAGSIGFRGVLAL